MKNGLNNFTESKQDPIRTESLYVAYLGDKNPDYYLSKFRKFDREGSGLTAGWNWPAFFFSLPWTLYRKMYGWFFALLGLSFVAIVLDKKNEPSLSFIISIISWIAFSIYANSLYHKSVKRKIARAEISIKDHSRVLLYLKKIGGVSAWVIWVWCLIIVAIVVAIAIPQFAARNGGF